jgi:sigma-B regulation protein RsbU (phosphoserine phosphatase)
MEQQQIHVSLSVGTKLLFSIVLLVFTITLFLNISTILLFREDKRAYIYQSQSTETLLTSKEFLVASKHALETLRVALAAVDPRQPLEASQASTLSAIMSNQSEILGTSIYLVDVSQGTSTVYTESMKERELAQLTVNPADYQIPPSTLLALLPELLQNKYGFVNVSKPGETPLLAAIFADTSLKDNPAGMPVAIGLISLKEVTATIKNLKITVATRSGWLLYDSDTAAFFSKQSLSDNPLFQAALSSSVTSGTQEYEYQGTSYLGTYALPGLNLVVLNKIETKRAMTATYLIIEKFILLGSMAVGAAIIFAILFAKTLTAPLEKLYEATKEIASGNFLLELDVRGGDEIGALSGSFNTMSHKISELILESVQKNQLENELAIASTVQQTLIPPFEDHTPQLDIYSHYQAASQCGGDWWGYFSAGNKVAIIIGDATGHGLTSALITASARSCFSVMHKLAHENKEFVFSPGSMLSFANRVIFDASLGRIMMTLFVAVIDFDKMTISYSSAGHNPPWLMSHEGGKINRRSLVAVGPRLGDTSTVEPFEERSVPIRVGDILFLYTDGLTEGVSPTDEMYTKKRARMIVEKNMPAGPKAVVDSIIEDFQGHTGLGHLKDDVTIAAIQIKDPNAKV